MLTKRKNAKLDYNCNMVRENILMHLSIRRNFSKPHGLFFHALFHVHHSITFKLLHFKVFQNKFVQEVKPVERTKRTDSGMMLTAIEAGPTAIPVKKICSPGGLQAFEKSETHQKFLTFIRDLCGIVKGTESRGQAVIEGELESNHAS